MMDFSQKTYGNILGEMLGRISDAYDKRDASPIPTALGPAAYALEGFYLSLDRMQRDAFVATASGDALDELAVLGGLTRYDASPAVVLGEFDGPVPLGARFSALEGEMDFTVTAAAQGPNQYRLTADTPGTAGNHTVGPLLPITAVDGLTAARVTQVLIPGDDREEDEALRARLVTALNNPAFGGNVASYRTAILALDGVGAVQIYPTWNGGGTVKCSVLGADGLPGGAELVEQVQTAVDPAPGQGLGLAPIGAQVTVTAPEAVAVNVSAALTLAPGCQLEQIQPLAEAALEACLAEIRRDWDSPVSQNPLAYGADVYLARMVTALMGTTGVLNAAQVTLNGAGEDLSLTQSGQVQQVPVLGEVTLRAL